MEKSIQALGALALLAALAGPAGGTAQAQAAEAACPPVPQAPTAQQLREGAVLHARDRGLLWQLRKDGRTSYLYGTLHLGTFEWAFPGPTVARALRATDTLALELNPADPAVMQALQAGMQAPPGEPPLPPALRARLDALFVQACVPAAALAGLHPVMQAVTLTTLASRRDGLDPAWGQEMVLLGFAHAAKREVVSLETAQGQLGVLLPRTAAESEESVEQMVQQLESGTSRRLITRMGQAWASSDLDTLTRYAEWCDCIKTPQDAAQMVRLNDERNPALADGIAALHGQGKQVFAAVGALHMIGGQPLPALMAKRGFEVRQLLPALPVPASTAVEGPGPHDLRK